MLANYTVIVEESLGKLRLAWFIPGLISAIVYAACIIVRVKLNPDLAGTPIGTVTWSERFASLKHNRLQELFGRGEGTSGFSVGFDF